MKCICIYKTAINEQHGVMLVFCWWPPGCEKNKDTTIPSCIQALCPARIFCQTSRADYLPEEENYVCSGMTLIEAVWSKVQDMWKVWSVGGITIIFQRKEGTTHRGRDVESRRPCSLWHDSKIEGYGLNRVCGVPNAILEVVRGAWIAH